MSAAGRLQGCAALVTTTLLFTIGPALSAVFALIATLIASLRARAVMKSVFRRPSETTTLVKIGNEWVEITRHPGDPRATTSRHIRNGGEPHG